MEVTLREGESNHVICESQELTPPRKGSFQVTFNNWSTLTSQVSGWKEEALPCSEVPCVGYKWKLQVYPESGRKVYPPAPADHIGVFLHTSSCPLNIGGLTAGYSISLHSSTGAAHGLGKMANSETLHANSGRGWQKFISHEQFRDVARGFIVDDTVRFIVRIRLTGVITSHLAASGEKVVRHSRKSGSLAHDFLALLESGRGSDIILNAGQGEGSVQAHRTILMARSKVFSAMLEEGKFAEGSAKSICIDDMDVATLQALVRYLYTAEFPSEEAGVNAQNLLIAADKYDLQELKQHCEQCLDRSLEPDCAAEILVVADSYYCSSLKVRCLDVIKQHTAQVMSSLGWTKWLASNATLLNQVLAHIAGCTANSSAESRGTKRRRDE